MSREVVKEEEAESNCSGVVLLSMPTASRFGMNM